MIGEQKNTFSKFCREKEYGWIFIDLNPATHEGLTCKLLVGGRLWDEQKMQEEGYIFTDVDKERIFESARITLIKDRPSFRIM